MSDPNSKKDFVEVVRIYQPKILNFLTLMTKDREMARELTQECFLKAYRSLDHFDSNRSWEPWLITIARNLAYDWANSKHTRTGSLDEAGEESHALQAPISVEKEILKKDLKQKLSQNIESLTLHYREVLSLFYFQELSIKEIGDVLGLPINTVLTRLARARQQLKLKLKHKETEYVAS